MTRLQMSSKTRTDFRKSVTKQLRRDGQVPATVYGRGGESQSVQVSLEELKDLLKTPGAKLSLIDLKVDGKATKAHPVMIAAIQREPVKKNIVHIDFHRVSMDEPVNATVPLIFLGEPEGLKNGGIFEAAVDNLEIKALPDRVPTHINLDVSGLGVGDNIHVKEIQIPEGVEVLAPPADIVVAAVRLPAGLVSSAGEEAVKEAE